MFIYNFKVNGSKIFKYFFTFIVILIVFIMIFVTFKVFNGASTAKEISSCIPQKDAFKIATKNYTNVLKSVHDNIDTYVGKKINFVGYVYRVSDLKDSQFVLARDMIISSNRQYVVVGFLCDYALAKDFKDGTWVEMTGKITKGDYHGDMPIIEVSKLKVVDKPNEEYVYPPDESYIPTSEVLG